MNDNKKLNSKKRNTALQSIGSLLMYGLTASIILSPQIAGLRALSEYSVHVMLGMLMLVIVTMLSDKRRMMLAALACTAALCLWLKNASNHALRLPDSNQEVKLKVAHVNLGNLDEGLSELAQIVIGEELDVVSFQELTPDWGDMLRDSLLGLLPYRYQQVRIDPYGMAVYSKHPLQMADTMQCRGIPMLHIAVDKGDARFHLVSSYLTPALDQQSLAMASSQLQRLSREVVQLTDPVIALGEYNMTYWTPEIREFRATTKLENSRRDIAQGNLRVPYDHIFFSENLECVQFNEMKGASQKYLGIRGTYQLKSEVLSQYKELAN